MTALYWVLLLVVAQRLAELVLAARNTQRLLARGGIEIGRRHYPLLVLLHGAWLAALLLLVPPDTPPDLPLLGVFLLLQAMRVWIIASLGRYWTTRVVTVPGEALVRRGPYRLLRHPNYAVVAGEIAVLPLAFGAWGIAALFSALNAVLLAWRIRVEEEALASRRRD